MKNSINFFIGTTAEFIKLAPIIKELKRRRIYFKIIASGQNQINFQDFESYTGRITSIVNFPKKNAKSSIIGFLYWTVKTFVFAIKSFKAEIPIVRKNKSYLIIHGDTITSLVGAIAGKLSGLEVVQVESGLRSFKLLEPLPEEISRRIISKIADVHFAPNSWALNNLTSAAGVKINTMQNTLIESCMWAIKNGTDNKHLLSLKNYYVLFIHRQEHIYFNQSKTREIINTTIKHAPKNLSCVLVMHALTSRILNSEGIDQLSRIGSNLITLPKLPYRDFINLISRAEFIATDSCTSQEEASYLGVPYLGLRNLTERIEGLGENVVISKGNIKTIKSFLSNYKKYKRARSKSNFSPSEIVVKYLLQSHN